MHLHTEAMSLSKFVMMEPVSNIKTVWSGAEGWGREFCHIIVTEQNLCLHNKSSMGGTMTSSNLIMWTFLNLFSI